MKNRTYTLSELILKSCLLFSILTVIQGVSQFENINKLWIVLVVGMLLVRFFCYRYTFMQISILYLTILIHVVALNFTDFPLYHTNILFYFMLWVILYIYAVKSKVQIRDALCHSDVFITAVLVMWTALVGTSALLPSCYDGVYFYSFAGSSFRLMPAVLIIQALAMYMSISRRNYKYDWFLLLPTYAAFMNASRTYFAIYMLFLAMYIYMRCKSKRSFYLLMIPLAIAALLLMSVTGIAAKFLERLNTENSYFDFWGTFTSARSEFWKWDLEAFFALPILQQFVGNGFNFAYDVTAQHFGAGIWAHNDIINLLMNFGYIGVGIYLWAYVQLVRAYMPKNSGIPRMVRFLFHSAVWFNSMMNMSYTYLCAMVSYPLFLCVISERYQPAE